MANKYRTRNLICHPLYIKVKMKYHYIFLVGRRVNDGKLYMDAFFSYSEKDAKKYQEAIDVFKSSELWGTKFPQAKDMVGCKNDIGLTLNAMEIRSRYNNDFAMAHITADEKLDREFFEVYVDQANKSILSFEKLKESFIVNKRLFNRS